MGYDPVRLNGRLLLGLKCAELELHTIRARLTAGISGKASGELAQTYLLAWCVMRKEWYNKTPIEKCRLALI